MGDRYSIGHAVPGQSSPSRRSAAWPERPPSLAVLEAAGFEAVLVEAVGVGQSEIAVASMVDTTAHLSVGRLQTGLTVNQLQGDRLGLGITELGS